METNFAFANDCVEDYIILSIILSLSILTRRLLCFAFLSRLWQSLKSAQLHGCPAAVCIHFTWKDKIHFEAVQNIKPKQAEADLVWKMKSKSKIWKILCGVAWWYDVGRSLREEQSRWCWQVLYPLEENSWDIVGSFALTGVIFRWSPGLQDNSQWIPNTQALCLRGWLTTRASTQD